MSQRPPVKDWATRFRPPRSALGSTIRYPIWDELRQKCPIAHTERFRGVYLPTRYEDVRAIAYDPEHFSSRKVIVREFAAALATAARRRSPPTRRGTGWRDGAAAAVHAAGHRQARAQHARRSATS